MAFLNRKARYNFEIIETFEAGMVLRGTEIKSIRAGRINFKDSYAAPEDNEIFLFNFHISPYEEGNRFNHEPLRKRKLLLKKREIKRLTVKVQERGLTLVPTKLYFKRGLAKIELGLGKGKTKSDKRETIRRRDIDREMQRELKGY